MTRHNRRSNNGFTLVEIIVVLVILAVLAAVAIPSLIGFITDAKNKTAIVDARTVYTAGRAGLTAWYGDPNKSVGNSTVKREIEQAILPYLEKDLNMTSAGNNQGWSGSNRFEIGGGEMIESGSYSWNNFVNAKGSNRAIIWVAADGAKLKGVYYMSKDGKAAVRIVYEASRDFPVGTTVVSVP